MGAWGTGIYDDDVASDVKDEYIDLLKQAKSNEEATEKMIKSWDTEDIEEGPIFWFALADTQWEYGRLLEKVKEKALCYLKSKIDLERWEEDKELYNKRKSVLEELEEKLNSPMPKEKRIVKYRSYICPWKIGDVYAYQIKENEEYKGKYIVMIKVDEGKYWPHNICPIVYIYNKMFDKIPKIEELEHIPYLPQFFRPEAYNGKYEEILYKCFLGIEKSTQKHIMDYMFIGNSEKYMKPKNEYKIDSNDNHLCNATRFEKYITYVYNNWKGIKDYYL